MLPDSFLAKMQDMLKEEYPDYLESFSSKACQGLRINTSKIKRDEFLDLFPSLEPIPWSDNAFYVGGEDFGRSFLYDAGLIYLQDPSAMLPAEILPIEEGDVVLDVCAAPGGKSLKLLNKLTNTGVLVANDLSQARAKALLRNIERQGFTNIYVTAADGRDLEKKYPETFDKILLDAPCSGEGMFRKDPSLIASWEERGSDYYIPIQKDLLCSCLRMLKEGGQIVYSTCTFDTGEDEDVIDYALSLFPQLKVVPFKEYPGFVKGRDGLGVKLFPHRIKGEGQYAVLLQKGEKKEKKTFQAKEVREPDLPFFDKITKKFYNGCFKTIENRLYFIPDLETSGIRVLRSGLLLGEIKGKDLVPSQALAMALKKEEFDHSVSLSFDDRNIEKYLKGETLRLDEKGKSDVLICLEKWPLGFGKLDNGILKNKIEKGWIRR